ncbi:hypothetical protein Q5O89_26120 [Peribacillus frigoritolerans]|nr:hypothetical protein [Peribacillus frigoritolerans]
MGYEKKVKKKWFIEPKWEEDPHLTEWYDHKQKQLHTAAIIKKWIL